jgi:hypothetical protein
MTQLERAGAERSTYALLHRKQRLTTQHRCEGDRITQACYHKHCRKSTSHAQYQRDCRTDDGAESIDAPCPRHQHWSLIGDDAQPCREGQPEQDTERRDQEERHEDAPDEWQGKRGRQQQMLGISYCQCSIIETKVHNTL